MQPDMAISLKVIHCFMSGVEQDYHKCEDFGRRRYIVRSVLLFMAAFLVSLRGEEVPCILRKFFIILIIESFGSTPRHCVLPLYGRFKTERGVPRCYVFRLACLTKSGLSMEMWVSQAIEEERGRTTKYLFANRNRKKEPRAVYKPYLYAKLRCILAEDIVLIPKSLDIKESYGIGHSFRHGSVTAAENTPNNKCIDTDIKRNNR